MTPDVSLITCTGFRPEAFSLCVRWMARQQLDGLRVQWIIMDDQRRIRDHEVVGESGIQDVCVVWTDAAEVSCTMPINLHDALGYARGDVIVVIEDDDWYAPEYVKTMWHHVVEKENAIVGTAPKRYYHVGNPRSKDCRWNCPRYLEWRHDEYSSLCRTAIARSLKDHLREICWKCHAKGATGKKRVETSVDVRLWESVPREDGKVLLDDGGLCISMKGLPGRMGAGRLHKHAGALKHKDKNWAKLYEWIGEESEVYRELMRCQTRQESS